MTECRVCVTECRVRYERRSKQSITTGLTLLTDVVLPAPRLLHCWLQLELHDWPSAAAATSPRVLRKSDGCCDRLCQISALRYVVGTSRSSDGSR